jgi:AcrR family transcriptional regulator
MMDQPTESQSQQRTPLDRVRVLSTAVSMADDGGLEAVTMRKLAQRLGVEAMSLYYHVSNKDEILDGMIDIVIGEIELPMSDDDWKPAMRKRAISAHRMLAKHPWAIQVMETRVNPGPASLKYYDSVIGSLIGGGFSIALAAHAFSAIDAYIYGFSLQQLNLPFEDEHDIGEVTDLILEHLPVDEYPHFAAMITDHALQPGYSYADEFEFGLDLILDGFERLLTTG